MFKPDIGHKSIEDMIEDVVQRKYGHHDARFNEMQLKFDKKFTLLQDKYGEKCSELKQREGTITRLETQIKK